MSFTDSKTILDALQWRYATKKFDSTRKIPADLWETLEQSLVLAPSSYGLQPYRFLVIDSAEVRQQLLPLSWNQAQVVDASHYIVLTIQKGFALPQIDHMLERVAEVRGVGLETLDGYKKFMVGDLVQGPRSAKIDTWASNQTYIAYGTIMATAALLGIDACPLEGFQPDKYDELLGLEAKGLHAVAALALGYRDSSDKYATLPKVRLPQSEIITHI